MLQLKIVFYELTITSSVHSEEKGVCHNNHKCHISLTRSLVVPMIDKV